MHKMVNDIIPTLVKNLFKYLFLAITLHNSIIQYEAQIDSIILKSPKGYPRIASSTNMFMPRQIPQMAKAMTNIRVLFTFKLSNCVLNR